MTGSMFDKDDLEDIRARGISLERISDQIETIKRGFPFARILRPCTIRDGITAIDENDLHRLGKIYSKAASAGRAMKFVPASGAATRMFKLLISFNDRPERFKKEAIIREAEKGDPDCQSFLRFFKEIKGFAFYEDLAEVMVENGVDIDKVLSQGDYRCVLDFVLSAKGLNLANRPKGLIPFHKYPGHRRTPFEEHLVEAGAYTKSDEGWARVHFTVSPEHEKAVRDHIERIRGLYEGVEIGYEIGFSQQKPSTDTIALDMENIPFRDTEGRLLFRPGGHGALIENLNDLQSDVIYIKNIDNVVPDRLKQIGYLYKKALGGYLIDIQNRIFQYIRRLTTGEVNEGFIAEVFDFLKDRLSLPPVHGIENGPRDKQVEYFVSKLNRPIRICGMVRNVSEPGGGPFWVEQEDKAVSIQIVETSQIDLRDKDQKFLWESSTHFNPVDIVLGVRDYSGKPFDLTRFVDPNSGFISKKSYKGRNLKALELPGLWNGSMAYWNTVFVEVPLVTFNPVKTVFDLLRKEHQPD